MLEPVFKVTLSSLRKFLEAENYLKMLKNAFHLSNTLLVLIFNFLF